MPNQHAVALAACQASDLDIADLKERLQHAQQRLTDAYAAALVALDHYESMRSDVEDQQLLDFTCGVGRRLCTLRPGALHA